MQSSSIINISKSKNQELGPSDNAHARIAFVHVLSARCHIRAATSKKGPVCLDRYRSTTSSIIAKKN